MKEREKTIRYPGFLNTCGDIIGTLREISNLEMNEEAPRFKRGDRGQYVDRLGMRGELIARFICFTTSTPYEAPPLFAPRPVGGADIICLGRRFDVKMIRTDSPDLLVNKDAHEKPDKNITHYWFFQQTARECARYWIFSHAEVSAWSIKNVVYSDVYFCQIA